MKKTILGALLAAATGVPVLACAQPISDWTGSGNVSLVSDYRFRSISQTYGLPAIQGGIDLAHSAGFYVGTWASNVSGNQYFGGNSMEWDFYAGYRFEVARNVGVDVGFMYYLFPGAKQQFQEVAVGLRYDTYEIYGAVTFGGLTAKLNYALSDYFAVADSSGSYYIDLTYNYPIGRASNLQAHVGRQHVKNSRLSRVYNRRDADFTDYKIGFTTTAAGLNWGIAYVGNNADERAYTVRNVSDDSPKNVAKGTVVVSVGKTF